MEIGQTGLKKVETMLSKEFRLKVMNEWDRDTFNKLLGGRDSTWGIVIGRELSGSGAIAQELA